MILSGEVSIKGVQLKFSDLFPGLRLAFYEDKHGLLEGSAASKELGVNVLLSEIGISDKQIHIDVDPQQSVAAFEKQFEQYNLHVQVFRKSNKLWLQTTRTDNWTLFEQNRKGLHSSQVSE